MFVTLWFHCFFFFFLKDEPLTPDDDVDRQLKGRKQQVQDDDSAEIEAASFKKFPVEVNTLARVNLTTTTILYVFF